MNRSDSKFADLFYPQGNNVHHEIDFLFLEPAFRHLSLLKIAKKIALVTVLRHEDGLLPEPINVDEFDQKFALISVIILNGFQFFKVRFNLSWLCFKHSDLRCVDSHHLLGLSTKRHI